MKIQGGKPVEKQDAYIKTQKAGKPDAIIEKGATGKVSPVDRVELSGKAKELVELKNAISQIPDIRTDKVQAIEKAIAQGSYRIDSNKIAQKMIDELV